jgi:hypothetical protein
LAAIAAAGCTSARRSLPARVKESGATADAGWRDRFDVRKSDLGPTGSSDYFVLVPGAVATFRDGDEELVITVLDETRVVDGVTTRVVEEREGRPGQPAEISRNYMAIDHTTGDVYYFGEDVDVFDDGQVSGHPGAWESGRDGARFGLLMPGHPKVGDRFYQEIAPGVAMDRAEVVSVGERLETPAGVFDRCVRVRETNPMEKGADEKWYAPRVGLVRDEEMELVSFARGGG